MEMLDMILKQTLIITTFVLGMMMVIEYINIQTRGLWSKKTSEITNFSNYYGKPDGHNSRLFRHLHHSFALCAPRGNVSGAYSHANSHFR